MKSFLKKNISFLVAVQTVFIIHLFSSVSYSHDCISFTEATNILEGFPKKPIIGIESDINLEEAYCAQDKLNYLIKKKYNDK